MRRGGGKETVKRKIDWLQFGQFLKMVVDLFTMLKTQFNKRKIGPEILEWLTGPGKEAFERDFLPTLSEEYLRFVERERQKTLSDKKPQPLIAEVDLDANPDKPFDGAILTKHLKQGKVRVEYRPDEDELYVGGKKVVLWLSKEQLAGGVVKGVVLQPEAERNNPINATLVDWLCNNQSFIPKRWQGRTWFFWGSEWCVSGGGRYVCCLYWDGTGWDRDYRWLDRNWYDGNPSTSLAPSS